MIRHCRCCTKSETVIFLIQNDHVRQQTSKPPFIVVDAAIIRKNTAIQDLDLQQVIDFTHLRPAAIEALTEYLTGDVNSFWYEIFEAYDVAESPEFLPFFMDVWLAANRLGAEKAQNALVDMVVTCGPHTRGCLTEARHVDQAYALTGGDCTLRRVMLYLFLMWQDTFDVSALVEGIATRAAVNDAVRMLVQFAGRDRERCTLEGTTTCEQFHNHVRTRPEGECTYWDRDEGGPVSIAEKGPRERARAEARETSRMEM